MKHIFSTLLLSLTLTLAFAQKEANTWYFSTNLGIDFNSGTATLLTVSGMSEYEGCSSISDPNTGVILMYTDGLSVWGANHVVMPNGTGLQTTYACGQEGLIVLDPGNSNQYYIFTSGEYYSGGVDGYRYNIVDMTLNGGLGDVTAVKNVLLYAPACEKVCAIKNASGTGYWIATHEYYTNNFVLYELTASGLSAPVVSSVGTTYTGGQAIGCMKFSPDGTRLGTVLSFLNEAEVYDFNAATGVVSNPITLGPVAATYPYVYGISFSPSGKRLYVDEENDNNLYQFDLTSGVQATINATKVSVGNTLSYAMQTIQLAPDGKMYVCRNGGAYLAVVNDPDSLGVACNFVADGFYLGGGYSSYGLPGFPEQIFNSNINQLPSSQFSAVDTSICAKTCTDFTDLSTNSPTSWHWSFPGGSPDTSSLQNPGTICYDVAGTYDVILITTNQYGSDTLTLPGYMTVYNAPATPVITQAGNTLTCSAALTYQWKENNFPIAGATNQSYVPTGPALVTVVITDANGCTSFANIDYHPLGVDNIVDLINITIYPNPNNGIFNIGISGISHPVEISVVNVLGQIVFSETIETTSAMHRTIDLTALAAGVYFIELKTEGGSLKKKIVIGR